MTRKTQIEDKRRSSYRDQSMKPGTSRFHQLKAVMNTTHTGLLFIFTGNGFTEVQLDPTLDAEQWTALQAIMPDVVTMKHNEHVDLDPQWEIRYGIDERTAMRGKVNTYVVTEIRANAWQLRRYAEQIGLTADRTERAMKMQHPHGYSDLDAYKADMDKLRAEQGDPVAFDAGTGEVITDQAAVEKIVEQFAQSDPDAGKSAELDEWFPRWSAIKEPTIEKQSWSAYGHFKREAEAINELTDVGREVHIALDMELEKHVEKHGIGETCKKLQERLDYLKQALTPADTKEDQPVTDQSPEIVEITKDQWREWFAAHPDWKDKDVLSALHFDSIERGEGPVTKLSEWDGTDLKVAHQVVEKWLQRKIDEKATSLHDTQATEPPKQEQASQSAKPAASNGTKSRFQKATPKNSKLRLAIGGVPGGGKTRTALEIARSLFPDGKIAVIDTESGSASKYAKLYDFDVLELDNYTPESYIEAIHLAEDEGYDLVLIDSLSHEWDSETGILAIVDNLKRKYRTKDGAPDTWACWREASPRHQALVDTILKSKIHVIVTMRCKWDVVKERVDKVVVTKKVIGSLVQREKIEYEFDIVVKADEQHNLVIDKSRCPELDGWSGRGLAAGGEIANRVADWLTAA